MRARRVDGDDAIFFVDVLNADLFHINGNLLLNQLNRIVAPAEVAVLVVEHDDNFFAGVGDSLHALIIFRLFVGTGGTHDK